MGDEAFARWWARYLKMSASPGAAIAIMKANSQIDVRYLLAAVRAPSLVLHREGDALNLEGAARDTARRIPGGRFLQVPGRDHLPFLGDSEPLLQAIENMVDAPPSEPVPGLSIAPVLVAAPQVPSWRGIPAAAHQLLRRTISRRRRPMGAPVKSPQRAPGLSFNNPGQALQCGLALSNSAIQRTVPVSIALHVALLEPGQTVVGSRNLALPTRLSAQAAAGEALVARIVRDLVGHGGLRFDERPSDELEEGVVPIFAVTRA
jgi:hypothetical protein